MKNIEDIDIFSVIKERDNKCNKSDFGKLLIVAGCNNYRGAASLCTIGALRSGIGIVTLASIPEVADAVSYRIPECTYLTLPKNAFGGIDISSAAILTESIAKYSSCLFGCGMGDTNDTKSILTSLIMETKVPLIIDADGINSLKVSPRVLKNAKEMPIITPHVKEFSRISGKSLEEIKENPIRTAEEFARRYNCVVVLKDYETVICAPESESVICKLGNVGLAKGGSGDLLAGIIASLRAQGYGAFISAVCGVYLHAASADICAEEMSYVSMLPSDIANRIDRVFKRNNR